MSHPAPSAPATTASETEAAFRTLLASLPVAGYLTDALGRITYFNEAAAALWGRRPALRDDRDLYCGSWRLYAPDGDPIPHPDCWAAKALHEDGEYLGRAIVIERPDGSRVDGVAHAMPLRDGNGRPTGVVNFLLDAAEGRGVGAAVNEVVEALSTLSGEAFFTGLVRLLCRTCAVDTALVAVLDPARPGLARIVACEHRGAPGPEIEYELRGTPCDVAVRSDFCSVPSGVCARYPDDPALAALGADAYVGKLLHSSDGRPIGIVAVLHGGRLAAPAMVETIVRVVAVRTGAELAGLQARRALGERERLLRLSQTAGRVGSWEFDPATDLARWSAETNRLFGRPGADCEGSPEVFLECTNPEDRDRLAAAIAEARSGRPPKPFEVRVTHANGEERLLYLRGEFMEAEPGSPTRLGGVVADVTEQRREQVRRIGLERELRRSEERYRRIVEATRAGVAVADVAGRLTFVNPRLEELFGADRGTLLGTRLIDRAVAPTAEDRRRLTLCCTGRDHDRGEAECGGEIRLRGAAAAELFVRYDATALYDDAGERNGTLFLLQDETERRRMDEERRKLREGMILQDRLASVGTLAAGVAHEINNPLAYVLSNLELARESLRRRAAEGTPASAELLPLLEQALEGVARVRATVRGLRTFARADEERRRPTDLRRVLDVAADLAGNEVRHRATLVKDYGAAPCVDADEGRMAQVFVNLIVNASQAMPDGEGANRRIKLRLRGDDRQAFVEIEDEGCGMSPEVLARAFEPFFTTKPVGVGSGLGLSICHGIVSAHGGSIELRSAPGRGTVVRIGLPRSRAASPVDVAPAREERATPYANEGDAASLAAHPNRGAAPSRDPAAEEARRPYVLVVDDDPLVARATARILARECETLVVGSGAEALAAIANRAPDVVLCDLMMPEMTGMELYARLRAERPAAAERMVFMTGGAFTASARDFLDRTPHPRVEKPFLPGELRAVVARTAARAGRAPTPAAIP